ncbi:MAG: glycosyltransferase family 2 protein [Actinomycetota bacterium]|nr:glycosyltransferase family 2 protein [Actinomycetota bacterium]
MADLPPGADISDEPVAEGDPVDVSILMVGYKTRDELARCLESVQRTTTDVSYEIVLVDNNSEDGTVEMIRRDFPAVKLVALDENLGFGRGVNLAATKAAGRYYLLLNPDTIVHEGAIGALMRFAQDHPTAGLVGGRTLRPDGTHDPGSAWGRPTVWSTISFGLGLSRIFKGTAWFDPEAIPDWDRSTPREVGVVTGCLVFVSREVWDELGGFDTDFFMYSEDTDLSMRAWEAGYHPMITPDAVITHVVGASSAIPTNRRVLVLKGKSTLFRKHFRTPLDRVLVVLLACGVGVRALMALAVRAISRGRKGNEEMSWVGAWQRRGEWLGGW